jgi:alcohol dehydrogenase
VPHAQANLAKIPDELADEQVVPLADIASTGISAAESAELQIGDSVAVFGRWPIGLCATAGAKLKGASLIIAVESDPVRTEMSKRMGADVVLDFTKEDVVENVNHLTRGRGVDVAIEALGTQTTFESALPVLRPGGTLSSLGVYSAKLSVPAEPFAAGLGDHKIVTTLCPGGKERMRRLMELVRHGRLDLTPLLTHTFALDQINEAYQVFAERRNGVIKVAISPLVGVRGNRRLGKRGSGSPYPEQVITAAPCPSARMNHINPLPLTRRSWLEMGLDVTHPCPQSDPCLISSHLFLVTSLCDLDHKRVCLLPQTI